MNTSRSCVHPTGLSVLGTLRHPSRRRAVVVPFVAILMTVLLAFVALTVDIGYVCETATEMQMAVDASALAGASALLDGANESRNPRDRVRHAEHRGRIAAGCR